MSYKKIKQIIKKIKQYNDIAIFHHENIDGDSLSSSYGLLLALKKRFPKKNIVWVVNEKEMKQNFPWIKYDKNIVAKNVDDSYLGIIGDTSAIKKMNDYETLLKCGYIICFDHHQNKPDIKHELFWHEPTYPASSLQAIELAWEMNVDFDEEIAFHLMIGILTDTGNFAFSLANPKPPIYFGSLLKSISNKKMDFYWNNMRSRTKLDIELQKFFFNNLKFDGNVAYVYLTKKDLLKFGDDASLIDFKLKVHSIGNIEGYPIWAFFYEDEGKQLKLHLRSNGPNVFSVAEKYGGGGHIRAAGATVDLSKHKFKDVLKELNNL